MIQIDPHQPAPLYRQIADEFRRLIVLGAIRPGERLPTVRELAAQVRVNRNTAARAIQLLEAEGLVRTRVGQGTFVESKPVPTDTEADRIELDSQIDRMIVDAQSRGVPLEDLARRLERRIERFRGDVAGNAGRQGRDRHE